jgi:hypothetical protein
MADEWDSSPAWAAARERTRAEVQAAFAPREQTCPSCGRAEATAARHCPHCGASYVFTQPKLSKRARLTIAGAFVGLLAAAGIAWAIASPSIDRSKQATARREATQQAEFIRSETARLKVEQRLHRGKAPAAGESRPALVASLQTAISADAGARVKAGTFKGPIRRVQCQAVGSGPLVPNAGRGGYVCLAVTADIVKGVEQGGQIGYPFWGVIDFQRGTLAWCKVNPKPGEMATQSREPVVDPPAGCNLHI